MKKRLLALALCLVLAVSLLPITAAAESTYLQIRSSGFEKGAYGYVMKTPTLECYIMMPPEELWDFSNVLKIISQGLYHDEELTSPVNDAPLDGEMYYLKCGIFNTNLESFHSVMNALNATNCLLDIPGFKAVDVYIYEGTSKNDINPEDTKCLYVVFQVTKDHDWQFTTTENSVTATCGNSGCPIGQASLTLDAHSVTLPDSPFNARVILKGITEEQIKEEFGYTIGPIRYKFKAPGDSTFTEITPADGAREGTYQASVTLTPLYPQASYALNEDGTANQGPIFEDDGSITLYTQYTAVNPEVTAQTGDNRPIELMMAGAAVFSALAAAAFILDHKRRNASL